MRIETINHPSGDQLLLLLDSNGLPIPTPNEFIMDRRSLSTNCMSFCKKSLWIAREE